MIRWSAVERKTLELLLLDGVEFSILEKALPNRTAEAIRLKAYKHNFGTKTINGKTIMYEDIDTRNRKQKEEATKTIVGETRVTPIIQEPTTSESTNQNLSDEIISKNELFVIYDELLGLLGSSDNPSFRCVTVELANVTIKVTKDGLNE